MISKNKVLDISYEHYREYLHLGMHYTELINGIVLDNYLYSYNDILSCRVTNVIKGDILTFYSEIEEEVVFDEIECVQVISDIVRIKYKFNREFDYYNWSKFLILRRTKPSKALSVYRELMID